MGPDNESSEWQEVSVPDGSRIVGDQDGNMVQWNGETGEVTITTHGTDPEALDDSMYNVSETDLDS